MAAQESAGTMKYPAVVASVDELNKMLAELKAKEADVRTQLESTQDTQKIEELKNLIQKIQQKRETIQFKLQELKTLKSEKIEK
jgi:predicted  nucleic acid-binding Zn-ribbon protein